MADLLQTVERPTVAVATDRLALVLEERETTRCFRDLVRLVGWGEANRLFDNAGLNDDRPTWPGKGEIAGELVDWIAAALMATP